MRRQGDRPYKKGVKCPLTLNLQMKWGKYATPFLLSLYMFEERPNLSQIYKFFV